MCTAFPGCALATPQGNHGLVPPVPLADLRKCTGGSLCYKVMRWYRSPLTTESTSWRGVLPSTT